MEVQSTATANYVSAYRSVGGKVTVPAPSADPASKSASNHLDSPWRQAGSQYDVRNMSPNQMREMANKLYASGAIDGGEMLALTQPTEVTIGDKSPSDGNQPMDYVGFYENQVDFMKQNGFTGPSYGLEKSEHILSMLERVEASGGSPVDMHA